MDEELLRIIDLFDNEEVTTADKIDRPSASSYREEFDNFNKRNPFANGGMLDTTMPKRGLVDGPGSYGGEKFNLKALGGEKNQYIKTYNTKGGEKRYIAQYDRPGFNKKKSFPFTPEGLEDARKARDGFENEFKEIKKTNPERVKDTSIRKLKNPPNPNKPWRYIKTTSTEDGKSKRQTVTYYESEAKAKAAQNKVLENRQQKRFKPITKDEKKIIKTAFEKNPNIAKVSRDTGIALKRVEQAINQLNLKLPEAILNDPKNKKYVLSNYGKKTRETMAKELFPNVNFKTANSRLGQIIQGLRKSDDIKETVAPFNVTETREKYKFNPDETAKAVSKKRIASKKKFSVPAFESAMQGSVKSQLSHMDDLNSQIVRFETLGYSPQKINQEILKNVDPYFNTLYKKRANLLKNKPLGYAKKINEINNKGIAAAYATKGYKSFNVIEPGGKSYPIGVDPSKSVDPFGLFEGKTIQEVAPDKLSKRSKTIDQMIPDPIDKYFFLKNAEAVKKAQANVPKGEIQAVAKNLNELGFKTSRTKLNAKIPGITELFEMAKSIPGDFKKKAYLKAGFKTLGIGVAPLVIYDTYNNYTQGKPILETLEQGIIGTDIIGGTKRFLALTPEEREARSVVKQDALQDLNLDMPMGFGFIEGPDPMSDLTLEEAQAQAAAGDERVKALEAQKNYERATNRSNFFGNMRDRALGAPQEIELAGGGIAGLSGGIDEGPQRTSMNPDSQGLRSLRNRVRNL